MASQNTVIIVLVVVIVVTVVAAAAAIIYYHYYYYNGIPFQDDVSLKVSVKEAFFNKETLFYLTTHLTPHLECSTQ
jgi:flagellar basal body-associated protein FliL